MDNTNLFPFENLEKEELLPVTLDVVFKEVFGQEDSKPILQSFLNAVLNLDIKIPEQIELLNPEINPERLKDKKCILDIKVRLPDKTSIDVEIQVTNQYNINVRKVAIRNIREKLDFSSYTAPKPEVLCAYVP